MRVFQWTAFALTVSLVHLSVLPLAAQADGLVQLRPLSTSNNSTSSVQPWQPSTASTPRIDNTLSTTYRTGVSAVAGKQYLTVRLNDRVSSKDAKQGDTISATLESPVMSGSSIIAPAGSEVLGSIVDVSSAKRAGIHGEVDLRFYTIVKPNGERVAMDAIVVTKHGGSMIRPNNYAVDAARGVGIAAAGAGVGAITGVATGAIFGAAGSGAALGTGIGAAAGIGYALWRPGKGIELPKGTLLQLQTQDASTAQVRPI
ncbi:MAG: hypothetical protein ACK551_00495 [Vampirovibrionales bacterium]